MTWACFDGDGFLAFQNYGKAHNCDDDDDEDEDEDEDDDDDDEDEDDLAEVTMDARMKACEECHRALVETTEGNQNFWDQSIQCVDDDENNDNHDYDHATTHCNMLICQGSIFN